MSNQTLSKLANKIIALRSRNGRQGAAISLAPNKSLLPLDGCTIPNRLPQPLTYKSSGNTGAMIALFLPINIGSHFIQSDPGALPPSELHITLAYLGKANDLSLGQVKAAHGLMRLISENHPSLTGHINGCGRFCNNDDDGDPFFIIPDLPALPNLRELITMWLKGNDMPIAQDHGFVPHITLTYLPHDEYNPFDILEKTPISFQNISLVLGENRYDYPLAQGVPLLSPKALIEKIGARHTGTECGTIQKMHDLTLNLGAECHPLTRRAGAKHSHADRAMVQRMHDDCVGLGAECEALPERDPVYSSQVLKERPFGAQVDRGRPGSGRPTSTDSLQSQRGRDEYVKNLSNPLKWSKEKQAEVVSALQENFPENEIKQWEASAKSNKKAAPSGSKQATNSGAFAAIFAEVLAGLSKKSLVTKAQSDAPNYAPASTPQRCANCHFFLGDPGRDWCDLFNFTADPDYVSDAWEAQRPGEIPGYVANKGNLAALTEGILILRGGRSSGNWGHAGRKGKRGGSGGGGGFGRIGVKPGSKPSRKKVQAAAKKQAKAKAPSKPKATSKKSTVPKGPAIKPKAKAKSKLDDIFDKAPKGTKQNFTNHLMNKMASGEISMQDAQKLNARFTTTKEPVTKLPTAKKKPTTKEKPSKPSKPSEDLKPGKGEKVSDGLRLEKVPKSGTGKAVHDTVNTINSVHSDGELTSVPIELHNSKNEQGSFINDPINQRAKRINVNRNGTHPHMTAAHEIGHNLDYQAIGQSGEFSESNFAFGRKDAKLKAKVDALYTTLDSSDAVKTLKLQTQNRTVKVKKGGKTLEYKTDKKYAGYLLQKREMFARAYAQYIATKSNDKKMLKELNGLRQADKKAKVSYPRQWSDSDFKTISKGFDDLFSEMEWIG